MSRDSSPRQLNAHNGHTYESFFEIEKPAAENDSCSLKDLFSLQNTKKRDINEARDDEKLKMMSQNIK